MRNCWRIVLILSLWIFLSCGEVKRYKKRRVDPVEDILLKASLEDVIAPTRLDSSANDTASIKTYPSRKLQTDSEPIVNLTSIVFDPDLILYVDPPNGHSSPSAMSVFARASNPNARVYYDEFGEPPTLNSTFLTYDTPYIQLDTPFKASRNRTLAVIAVETNEFGTFKSEQYILDYFVEGSARPFSFAFMVPGIESGGYFLRYGIEIAATARAQVAGGQEFADFFSELGLGTYPTQIQALDLVALDPDLQGFEGGFPVNTSNGKHYGILIPFHNGKEFFGKVVRVDLQAMGNISTCSESYMFESYMPDGVTLNITGTVNNSDEACVYVMDLATLHPQARGFRRGFISFPYGYLSAGQYSTVVRLDLDRLSLNTTRYIDLAQLDRTYGGYSGGFADGTWACFNPYRSFSGPVGGIRSDLEVDAFHLRPYFYATMLCVNSTAWEHSHSPDIVRDSIQLMDFSSIEDSLRGFSDALRVGRFAYLSPYETGLNVFASKLIRISLGDIDIGTTLQDLRESGGAVRDIIDILDLSKTSDSLRGFSGLFTAGRYLFLVPFRNIYEPRNGQRGHGLLVRLDMNNFDLEGLDYLDLPVTTRTQIPSFADVELRGYSGGFASGFYGMLVPFYNADFSGKIARFKTMENLDSNLQELDLQVDRANPNVYKGYRGGFVSLWQGVEF